jgi:hypothetical protein
MPTTRMKTRVDMKLKLALLTVVLFITATGQAQTWYKVADESTSNSLTLPVGTTYRFGVAGCPTAGAPGWSDPTPVTGTDFVIASVWYSSFPFADPCPGVTKEVDVLETTAVQTVTFDNAAELVPALPPPPPPSGSYMCGKANAVWESVATKAADYAALPSGTVFMVNGVCQTASIDMSFAVPSTQLYILRTAADQNIGIWDGSVTPATQTVIFVPSVPVWDASVVYPDDVVLYNNTYYVLLLPVTGIVPGSETAIGQTQHWVMQPAMQDTVSQWFTIGKQDDVVNYSGQTTFRYGVPQNTPALTGAQPCPNVGGCWSVKTFTSGSLLANNTAFGNPIINTSPKQLQVLMTTILQPVTVNGVAVTVPAAN